MVTEIEDGSSRSSPTPGKATGVFITVMESTYTAELKHKVSDLKLGGTGVVTSNNGSTQGVFGKIRNARYRNHE